MNKKTNKSKKIILSSLSLIGAATLATTILPLSLTDSASIKKDNLFLDVNNISRIASNNSFNSERIENPNEVFYSSEKNWASLKVFENGKKNESNIEKFKTLQANLEKIKNANPQVQILVQPLIDACNNVDGYVKFEEASIQLKQQAKDFVASEANKLLNFTEEEIYSFYKDKYVQDNPDVRETFDYSVFENISSENGLLEKLSGIVVGKSKIKSISSKKLSSFDIAKSNSSTSIDSTDIKDIAGDGYDTLLKIGEIDLSQNKNFVLNFTFRQGTATAKGSLIFRNDKEQLLNATNLKTAYENLDIFGRYALGATGELNKGAYKSEMDNFVLTKTNNKISILLRLKVNQTFGDISFDSDSLYAQGELGIYDVQTTKSKTFKDYLSGNDSASTKLMDLNEKDNQINGIQFYSDGLFSEKLSSSKSSVAPIDRKLEFYQAKGEEINFKLNYINTITNSTNDYAPLNKWSNAVDTKEQLSIGLKYDGDPTKITPSTIDFYIGLKDNLPDEIKKENIKDISKINLVSTTNTNKTIAQQSLSFAQNFYGIGNRTDLGGWTAVNITGKYKISLPNLTDKIFFEKPTSFTADTSSKVESNTFAQEQTDTRTNVIQILGELYTKWFNNDANYQSQTFTLSNIPFLTYTENNGGYSNIKFESINISGNGNELINGTKGINTYWKPIVKLINTLFSKNYNLDNEKRFVVASDANTGSQVVQNTLIGNVNYIPNLNRVQEEVNKAVEVFKKVTEGVDPDKLPTLEGLDNSTKEVFGNVLANLIGIQFGAIENEFKSQQLTPLYSIFIKTLNNSKVNENVLKVNDPSSILEFVPMVENKNPRLIKYKVNAWNSISTTDNLTLKDQLKTFIELMNFGSENNGISLIKSIINIDTLYNSYLGFSTQGLLENQTDYNNQLSQLRIFDKIFNFFGYSFRDSYLDYIQNPSSSEGLKITFKHYEKPIDLTFEQVVNEIIKSLSEKTSYYKPVSDKEYSSYWLDNIISGTNVISALEWKQNLLKVNLLDTNNNQNSANELETKNKVLSKINEILLNAQAAQSEQSAWSNVVNDSWDFNIFASNFSGREGDAKINETFTKLIENNTILSYEIPVFSKGELASITSALQYIWWILIALIGVGVIVAASVSIASRSNTVKLSSHPVIKWILFSLIALGVVAIVMAIVFGLVPLI